MAWAQKRGVWPNTSSPTGSSKMPISNYSHTVRGEWLWTYNNGSLNMGIGGMIHAMKLKTAA